MADKANAIKNDLNRRAREVGIFDQELTLADLAAVRAFYGFTCLKCGKERATSIDHVKALSVDGQNTIDNLQLLCTNCNKAKGRKEEDYRKGRILTPELVSEYANSSYVDEEIENENYSYEMNDEENSYKTDNVEIVQQSRNGGRRFGAGRKPKELTILKRRMIADKAEEAEASFGFLVAVRDNPSEPTNLRLVAAQTILDRVFGRATERSIEQKQITIKVIREAPEQRNSISPAPYLALGAGTD
jgi:hypothetical protein